MTDENLRTKLIDLLIHENGGSSTFKIPASPEGQKQLLRGLMNIRRPSPASEEFLRLQDEYLQGENAKKGVVTLDEIEQLQPNIYLWRGDITRLKCGAIVNAANSGMTGCYQPCHNCIDNCIHTYAGVQLRNYCADLMSRQGYPEPTGRAKITPAFNLPCDFVIHTVGPIVDGRLTQLHCRQLADCYNSCLKIAEDNAVDSIAFCCISTGVFMFPNQQAAEIAVNTVKTHLASSPHLKVIFNVFKSQDEEIYRKLLKVES